MMDAAEETLSPNEENSTDRNTNQRSPHKKHEPFYIICTKSLSPSITITLMKDTYWGHEQQGG